MLLGKTVPVSAALTLVMTAACYSAIGAQTRPPDGSAEVAKSYIKAIQSRDFETAYRYISDADQRVRDKASYLRSQEILSGFALELAKQLAAGMKVWVIDQTEDSSKIHFELGYRVPTGDEISSQLFDWNEKKLNSLAAGEQRRLSKALEELKRSRKMVTIQGQETVGVIREKESWRIFLDWQSRSRVIFKTVKPISGELEVEFLQNDFLVANNEPFQIDFTVKNRSPRTIVARLDHIIEPHRIEKNLAMIACGALLPLRLRPGETQDLSTSYILGGDLSPQSRVSIIYAFTLEPEAAATKAFSHLPDRKTGYDAK